MLLHKAKDPLGQVGRLVHRFLDNLAESITMADKTFDAAEDELGKILGPRVRRHDVSEPSLEVLASLLGCAEDVEETIPASSNASGSGAVKKKIVF